MTFLLPLYAQDHIGPCLDCYIESINPSVDSIEELNTAAEKKLACGEKQKREIKKVVRELKRFYESKLVFQQQIVEENKQKYFFYLRQYDNRSCFVKETQPAFVCPLFAENEDVELQSNDELRIISNGYVLQSDSSTSVWKVLNNTNNVAAILTVGQEGFPKQLEFAPSLALAPGETTKKIYGASWNIAEPTILRENQPVLPLPDIDISLMCERGVFHPRLYLESIKDVWEPNDSSYKTARSQLDYGVLTAVQKRLRGLVVGFTRSGERAADFLYNAYSGVTSFFTNRDYRNKIYDTVAKFAISQSSKTHQAWNDCLENHQGSTLLALKNSCMIKKGFSNFNKVALSLIKASLEGAKNCIPDEEIIREETWECLGSGTFLVGSSVAGYGMAKNGVQLVQGTNKVLSTAGHGLKITGEWLVDQLGIVNVSSQAKYLEAAEQLKNHGFVFDDISEIFENIAKNNSLRDREEALKVISLIDPKALASKKARINILNVITEAQNYSMLSYHRKPNPEVLAKYLSSVTTDEQVILHHYLGALNRELRSDITLSVEVANKRLAKRFGLEDEGILECVMGL